MLRALLVVLTLIPSLAHAWGYAGHRRLASKMQDAMPANHCLRNWFTSKQTFDLQDSACDPDRWRSTDSLEAPRHYLNIDWVNPVSSYPRDYAQAQAQLGGTYARTNGTVPWRVQEKYGELVAAFRSGNETQILEVAFVMSHYVFDSFSILHDTKNFDPNGLHERWESDMLENSARINAITTAAATFYGTPGVADPRNHVFDIVIVGNGLAPTLIAADDAGDAGVTELYNRTRDMTSRRWGDGITVMSSILWTAWNEAGRPNLSGFSASCSRVGPAAQVVLVGFPPAGGLTPATLPPDDAGVIEDAGVVEDAGVQTDAGVTEDGGVDGGPVGGGTGDGGGHFNPGNPFAPVGGGAGSEDGGGCSCTDVPMTASLLGLAVLGLLRSRRRRS
ncbi:MAG: MYXO-CTERM sorting domain-containing protein [Archangium sp.]